MFPSPLNVTLSPSRQLRSFILVLHLTALFAVWAAALEPLLQGLASLALAINLLWNLLPGQTTQLRCHADGRLELNKTGLWVLAQTPGHRVIAPCIVLLDYQVDGKHLHRLMMADCLAAEDFRQLRVWLRWQIKHPPAFPGQDLP